jgi:NADH dehydrogenase FAD-containing subunit
MMDKQDILLLGDGFFARGFLHHINFNKFTVTQIYKDRFINPQDLMYCLQRNINYDKSFHFRDLYSLNGNMVKSIQTNINKLELVHSNKIIVNTNTEYSYDYLVIGLGAQKSLRDWSNDFNYFVGRTNLSIGVVGMGPTGFEISTILSKNHKVDIFDMLNKEQVLNYISSSRRPELLVLLDKYGINSTYGQMYNPKKHNHDKVFYCLGTRPNSLTSNLKNINNFLQYTPNIYIGGDCANTEFIKTGQMAYQQGTYVAKRLNGEIPIDQPFEYKCNGLAVNIGENKVLIEGHKHIFNGIYPDFVIRLYSLFFI